MKKFTILFALALPFFFSLSVSAITVKDCPKSFEVRYEGFKADKMEDLQWDALAAIVHRYGGDETYDAWNQLSFWKKAELVVNVVLDKKVNSKCEYKMVTPRVSDQDHYSVELQGTNKEPVMKLFYHKMVKAGGEYRSDYYAVRSELKGYSADTGIVLVDESEDVLTKTPYCGWGGCVYELEGRIGKVEKITVLNVKY